MKKMKGKRLLSLLLTLCMVLSLVPATAFAAEGDVTSWDADTKTLTITTENVGKNDLYKALTQIFGKAPDESFLGYNDFRMDKEPHDTTWAEKGWSLKSSDSNNDVINLETGTYYAARWAKGKYVASYSDKTSFYVKYEGAKSERTVELKSNLDNVEISKNGYYSVSDENQVDIEANILDAVLKNNEDKEVAIVEVHGRYDLKVIVIDEYFALDATATEVASSLTKGMTEIVATSIVKAVEELFGDRTWGELVFDSENETIRIKLPSTENYLEAVSEDITIKVVESRPERPFEATATTIEAAKIEKSAIETAAIKAAGLDGVEGVTCGEFTLPTEFGSVVDVVITVAGDAQYRDTTDTVKVTVNKAITTAKMTVKATNGTVNEEDDATYEVAAGKYTLVVAPENGYYVDYITVTKNNVQKETIKRSDMTPSADNADYSYSYELKGIVAKDAYKVEAFFMVPDIAVAPTINMPYTGLETTDLTKMIKDAVAYSVVGNTPDGDLVVEYYAGPISTGTQLDGAGWVKVGTALEKWQTALNYHEFGAQATEKVRFTYSLKADNFVVTKTSDVTLVDGRAETAIELFEDADVVVTYGTFKDGDVLAQLVKGVYAGGSKVAGADDVTISYSSKNAGEQTVTITYAGDKNYKPSTVTAPITIKKAPVEVTVNSKSVKYDGTAYTSKNLVTTNLGDVDTINLIVGIDVAELQLDKENGVTGAEAVVMMQLPDLKADDLIPDEYEDAFGSILDNIFGAGASDKLDNISTSKYEGELSLAEVATLLQGMGLGNDVVTEDVAGQVMQNLKNIQAELGVEDIKVVVNGKPKNIGAYLVVGVTADQNYETAMNVGYLAITPDGYKATLDWKVQDENGAVALEAIENGNYDLGAYVTKVAEGKVKDAEEELELVFFGVDKDGNIVLTQDQKDLTLGAYTELAFIMNWGNTMYYAEPIARAFVVVPELVDVKFVDENGNENYDRVFVYDGNAHGMDVAVKGEKTTPGGALTVTYTGVTVEGTVYNDTDAPTLPGAYTVTAIYVERNNDNTIIGMGIAVGAMVIDMDAELVTVKFIDENGNENYLRKFTYDGNPHGMKAVATNAAGEELSDEYMTVTYVGIKGDGKGYKSTTPPTDAGIYTVTAVYEQRGEDGYIDAAGMAVGEMVIQKAVADGIVIENATVEYDGNEHFEEIFANGSVQPKDYIAVVYDEDNDAVNVLYPEKLDAIVDELREKVEGAKIPERLDEETLGKIDRTVDEIVDNIVVPDDFEDALKEALVDIEALLAEYDDLKDIKVTFNGKKPVEVGEYDIYVLTFDPNYESVYGHVMLEIYEHEHTFSDAWAKDDTYHWKNATCGHDVMADKAEHVYVNGTCECGAKEPTVPHEHTYSTTWNYNGTYHWKDATCGHDVVGSKAEHNFGGDRTCDTCGYTYRSGGGSGGGGGSTKYVITVEDTENGTLELSHKKASSGTTVTITAVPEAGYKADGITVTTSKGKTVEVKDLGNGKYTFKMPGDKVVVDGNFVLSGEGTVAEQKVIILTIDSVIAWVFDEYVANDVAPVIRNERTMLPARFVAEALGGVVTWNEADQKVTIVKGETTLEIFIGAKFAVVNGTPVELDCPAFIENSRTYLPIRFIAENLGATVTWDGAVQTVTIVPGN